MSYLFAILIFSFLIFIHELGHFSVAKLFGVQVSEFALFMGPALWQKQIGDTKYTVRLIPFGGYCAFEGEGEDHPSSFDRAIWWKRFAILLAGAAMNFISGVALLAVFFAPNEQFILPVVSQIEPECAFAGEYGVQEGDRIVSLDGERIYVYSDFNLILSLNPGDVHDLVLDRNGQRVVLDDLNMEKRPFPNADGSTSLRLGFSFSLAEATPSETAKYVWNTAIDTVRLVRLSLRMLFNGKAGVQDLSGPVGIVNQMAEVAEASGSTYYAVLNMLYFGAFIAINLAVMNLLPIPGLDGGRAVSLLLTAAAEKLLGRKIDAKYENIIHNIGLMFLVVLMVMIMFKDILFVFKR